MSDTADGQGSTPEDEIDRRLRELTQEITEQSRIREPSAAERAKTAAKLARQRQGRSRHGLLTASLIVVVVLAAAGGIGWLRFAHTGGEKGGAPAANASPSHPATAPSPSPSGTVAPVNLFSGPPADPFAGTPAETWADGAAGIVTPTAKQARGFTAAQMATAYTTTRKLLIAAALDKQTLLGGAPTAFASLLTRQQRTQFLASLNKTGLRDDGTSLSTRTWVASFAPGTTRLIGSVIKVHGTMSARAGTDKGYPVLIVKVNYRIVYPVEPPGAPARWMRVVGQITGSVEFGDWKQASTPFEPWMLFAIASAGVNCGEPDGYIHPAYPEGTPSKVQPSGPAYDPYSMTIHSAPGCQRATRT